MATRRQILDSLAEYVAFEIDEGRTTMEFSPASAAAVRGRGPAPVRPAAPSRTVSAAARPAPIPVSAPPPAPMRAARQSVPSSPPPAAAAVREAPSPDIPPARRPASEVGAGLDAVAKKARACKLCGLHKDRKQAVPGQGNPAPDILFVGEAPGADEDEQGLAFVGAAGQLLTQMIAAMGYSREEVFIANIAKCRPPNNRPPLPEEMAACLPYLKEQIRLLAPKVIVALGATAVKGLLNPAEGITRLRGKWQKFEGIPLMPTFHPAYLLRYPAAKHDVWTDLKAVLAHLGRPPPRKTAKESQSP